MGKFVQSYMAVVCVILFTSCQQKDKYNIVESFPVEKTLTAEIIPAFDSHVGMLGVRPAGEYVVGLLWKQDYFFDIFDTEHNLVGKLCRLGNGPNEFLAPAYFGQYDEEGIWILERERGLFVKIDISKSLAQGQTVIEKKIDLSQYPGLHPRNVFYITDELLFGTNDDSLCATFTLNPKTSEIKFNPHVLDFPISPTTHSISQSMATLKPDRKKVATSFFRLPQIDMYSSKGERLKTVFYKEIVEPSMIDIYDGCYYYLNIFSTDDYIYALYEEPVGDERTENYIHVFDWNGNPIASLKVDTTTDFYVSPDDKQLITLNFDAETDVVKKYDISFLK
jgi:hypothetical protein